MWLLRLHMQNLVTSIFFKYLLVILRDYEMVKFNLWHFINYEWIVSRRLTVYRPWKYWKQNNKGSIDLPKHPTLKRTLKNQYLFIR